MYHAAPGELSMATRKVSKPTKDKIVAFKVEEELAEFLAKLPNKSEFIRRAILAQFNMACPLCTGSGVVPRGLHDHYSTLLDAQSSRPCTECGAEVPIPRDVKNVAEVDRPRIEQFFHGGPLFCEKCYTHAPSCEDCGWHITDELAAEHQRTEHASAE